MLVAANGCVLMKKLISLLIRYVPRKYLQRVSGAGLKVLCIWYRGDAVTFPVCHKRFMKFIPYGRIKPSEYALCPCCMSLVRHRLMWLFLREITSFFNHKKRVLHIAPEACFFKRF